MRNLMGAAVVSFLAFTTSSVTAAAPSFTELLGVLTPTAAELRQMVASSGGMLTRGGDARDPRYFVLVASEGSGNVCDFTYLYVCDAKERCGLRAMHFSINSNIDVTYDEPAGQFRFNEGMKAVLIVPVRYPVKLY